MILICVTCIFLIFLLDLFVFIWDELLMGVKDSLTLGREEMPWVKGLVRFNIVVERFLLLEKVLLFMEYGLH